MKIRDLLAAESIQLSGTAAGKQEALDKMVDLMAKSGKINDVETYRKGVYTREEESTTGIGKALPFRIANPMQWTDRDLQPWYFRTVWILIL